MGAVGLAFGSPTSGAGFDVTATVNAILANSQAIETPWKTQLTSLESQDTVFTSLGSNLSTLTTDLQNLTDPSGVLANKEGSSSDTGVLTLTSASSSAVAGTHTIVVGNLAQTSSTATSLVGTADVLTGSITIQVGSGTAQTVAVDSTNPTLAGLSAAINAAGIGVTANVITDTTGSRLSLVSSTGGTAGQLTTTSALTDASTNGAAVDFTTSQAGIDASLTVDGVTVTSGTNTVSNAIPGVTFQLLAVPATAENVQVVITNNDSAVSSALNTLVTDYNTTIKAITAQEGKDSSGDANPLYGSPVLAQLQEQLQSAFSAKYASGSITSLSQLGIETAQDGTLTINGDTLTAALNGSYAGVTSFFQNAGSFGTSLSKLINNLGSSNPSGTVALVLAQNSSQEASLNANVAKEDLAIAAEKQTLTTELNNANEILQAIPSQLQEVNTIYSAITGYNQNAS